MSDPDVEITVTPPIVVEVTAQAGPPVPGPEGPNPPYGLLADRPSPTVDKALYVATDGGDSVLYQVQDGAWVEIEGGGGGTGTVTSVAGVAPTAGDVPEADLAAALSLSGSNTGDETEASIKTKLGITTLSGSNTGDQDLSGLATTSALTTESNARANADTTNALAITAETTRATAGEAANATAITNEATARAAADTTNANAITAEASTRATADSTNATAITTEATARAAADALLAPLASPTFTGHITVPTPTLSTDAATKSYVDGLVTGLYDLRGSYDASPNTFPTTGGSGTAGAVVKADTWVISVAGTLGSKAVTAGDVITAMVDTPGQTAGNWNITEHDIGYTPLNAASNLSDLTNAGTARTNLGLGTAATQPSSAFDVSGAAASAQAFAIQRANHTGTQSADTVVDGTTNKVLSAADKTRLANTSGTNTGDQDLSALAPKASPALTGNPTAPTQAPLDNTTKLATTAYADTAVGVETSRATAAEALKAPLASPALTGNPTAPTQTAGNNSTRVATTAYADGAVGTETSRATAAEALLASSATVTARSLIPTATKTGNYTAVAGDFVMVDATSGAITITAPTLAAGVRWGIRLVTASTNQVTASTGSGTFDTNGLTTLPMATGYALVDVTFAGNAAGTQWVATSSGKPNAYLQSFLASLANVATAPGGLTTFHAALANAKAGNGVCDVLLVGASRVEGYQATTRAARWSEVLLTTLRAQFQPAGIPGGAPNIHRATGTTYPLLYTTTGTAAEYANLNPAGRATLFSSAGSITFTVFGTSVDIHYTVATGLGSLSWAVDGGSATNFATAGTERDMTAKRITFGSRGTHTVTIAWVSGVCVLNGIRQYDGDETVGVRLFEAGHSGLNSTKYLGLQNANGSATPTIRALRDLCSEIKPHLIVIDDLAVNDAQTTSPASIVPTTTISNIQGIISEFRVTSPNASIVVAVPFAFNTSSFPVTQAYANFIAGMKAIVAADSTLRLWDETLYMPDPTTDTQSLYADGAHPANKGYQLMGQYAADVFLAGLPSPVSTTSTDVQIFTSSGTWIKPTGAKSVEIVIIGGGGGGGSGRTSASGTAAAGGSGGGSAGITYGTVPASALNATETVTVGASGGGGAGQTAASTNGIQGTAGGISSFGSQANNNKMAAGGGSPGNQATTAGAGAVSSGAGLILGINATATVITTGGDGGAALYMAAGAGGSGAGFGTTPAAAAGGSGSPRSFSSVNDSRVTNAGPGAGGLASGNNAGAAGGSVATNLPRGGDGGGGGSTLATATTAGAGGAGGNYGAGGGGGAASLNGTSGAGGAGGAGIVVVTTYL